MARTYPWKVSDALWERVEPVIPVRPPHPKGGRPAASDRQMFSAIIYVLPTGIQWSALPRELGASSTVYDRFRWWESQEVFQRLWQAGLSTTSWQASAGTGKALMGRWSKPLSLKPPSDPLPPTAANRGPNGACCVIGEAFHWAW